MLRPNMAVRETITISLPPELRAFLQGCVATGRYSSVREFERAEMGKTPISQQAMARQPPAPHDRA